MDFSWMRRPDRVPNLEREDLETIIDLIEDAPENEGIRRLRKKVEESMSFYHWQDDLLEQARARLKKNER